MRRFLTRLLAIIPSMAVAIAVGREGIDALLVASQVILSIVLPFITFPLLYCTSSKAIMSTKRRKSDTISTPALHPPTGRLVEVDGDAPGVSSTSPVDSRAERGASEEEVVDYSNNKPTIVIGGLIWLVIVAANVYAIVELAMGAE